MKKSTRIRYPWSKWFSKKKFSLRAKIDFTCMLHSMAQQIRNRALKQGLLVSIYIAPNRLDVEVFDE